MKHLQKFEGFIIPKPVRKFNPFWKDEDIALEILKELKSLKGNSEGISKLLISENRGYSFIIDSFKFHVKYGFYMSPGGGRYNKKKTIKKTLESIVDWCNKKPSDFSEGF